MATDLCRLWADLAADPDNADVIAKARARLMELVEHVDDCEECRLISESMETPEKVFAALGEDAIELSGDELKILRSMDKVLADDREAIDSGVEFLLAALPAQLGTLERVAGGAPVKLLQIFLAIDAVNMLVRSYVSRRREGRLQVSNAGLRIDGQLVSSREAVINEIVRHAGVTDSAAESLWAWQLNVGELCPTLYRGLLIEAVSNGVLDISVQKSASSADLLERWRIPREEVLDEDAFRVLINELIRSVAAKTREVDIRQALATRVAAADKKLGKLVEQIKLDNEKLVDVMAEYVEGTFEDEDEDDLARYFETIDEPSDIARYLKMGELRKRRYYNTLANVQVVHMEFSQLRMIQKFAAKGRAQAARNIIALDRYVKMS